MGNECIIVPVNYSKIFKRMGLTAKEAKYADDILYRTKGESFSFDEVPYSLKRRKEFKNALIALLKNGFLYEHSMCGERFKDIAFMDRSLFYTKFTWSEKALELKNIAEKVRDLRLKDKNNG